MLALLSDLNSGENSKTASLAADRFTLWKSKHPAITEQMAWNTGDVIADDASEE